MRAATRRSEGAVPGIEGEDEQSARGSEAEGSDDKSRQFIDNEIEVGPRRL